MREIAKISNALERGKAARQARWVARRKAKSMQRLDIWVPADRADTVRDLVRDMIDCPDLLVMGVRPEPGAAVTGGGHVTIPAKSPYETEEDTRQIVHAALDGLALHEVQAVAGFVRWLVTRAR